MTLQPIYRFHAELAHVHPKVWRRFEVQDSIKMSRLARVLLTLFEMDGEHLYQFEVPEKANQKVALKKSGIKEPLKAMLAFTPKSSMIRMAQGGNGFDAIYGRDEDRKADKVTLRQVLDTPGQTLNFQYDFGDAWEVILNLDEVFSDPELDGRELPRVLDGAGWGIVEDCGGPWGLMEMAEAFEKKSGEKYEELREWKGEDGFSLERFNLQDMNIRLKKLPRVCKQLDEQYVSANHVSIDLLERRFLEKQAEGGLLADPAAPIRKGRLP